jgi:DNA-binding NarL/FixJ family response regulator
MKAHNTKRSQRHKSATPVASAKARGRFRVVVVDQNPLCRRGLRELLCENGRFNLLGEAPDGDSGLKLVLEQRPHVVVLDSSLPDADALELAATLKAKHKAINLVVLAQGKDEKHFNRAISLGVTGYILKKNAAGEILDCIATVARGEPYVCTALTDFLLRRGSRTESLGQQTPGLGLLTNAERRILGRVAQGKTSREIAAEFSISPRTVDSHRSHICEKLDLSGKNRLVHFALEHRDAFGVLQ